MRIGVVIPQPELGSNPEVLSEFVKAAEELGYDYVVLYEIVLKTKDIIEGNKSHPNSPDNWHDPYILISYLAGQTNRIGFATGVSILPSRQTIHVAKQVASLDRLSKGRVRFGFSVGWNKGEYDALEMNFSDRGTRITEQIKVMRELWENDVVSFKGDFHNLDHVSLGIYPVQKPIPIWMGGYKDIVLKRAAEYCDGWCANIVPYEIAEKLVEKYREYVVDAGRRVEDMGVSFCATLNEPRAWREKKVVPLDWELFVNQHLELGATHLEISTTHFGSLKTLEEHIDAITRFKDVVQ